MAGHIKYREEVVDWRATSQTKDVATHAQLNRDCVAVGRMGLTFSWVRADRLAQIAFLVCVVVSIPVAVVVGSEGWFSADSISFFSEGTFTADGLFSNYSGHWVTVPLILHLALYKLFGLQTYVPYQLLAILSHTAIVVLVYAVMRRMLVQRWLAAPIAVTMLCFGAGAFNIFTAFQITFNGSLVCGLVFLLLVDHDGPTDRRNVMGVAVAVVGLMTSAAMGPMLLLVFTALLLRRGSVVALSHLALPAVVLIVWFVIYGTSQLDMRGTPGQTLEMLVRQTTETLEALGQNPVVGGVLGGVILFGLWCAVREALRKRSVVCLALPAALIVGWLSFSFAVSLRAGNLAFDPNLPGASRYVHVGAALLLPLIAFGGHHLARVRSILALVPITALALGVPGNINAYVRYNSEPGRIREIFLAVANSRFIDQSPGDHRPLLRGFLPVTVDWLRSARARGDIPIRVHNDDAVLLLGDLLLALDLDRGVKASCVPERGPSVVTVQAGDIIKFGSGFFLISLLAGPARSQPLEFSTMSPPLVVQIGPMDLQISEIKGGEPVYCIETGGNNG